MKSPQSPEDAFDRFGYFLFRIVMFILLLAGLWKLLDEGLDHKPQALKTKIMATICVCAHCGARSGVKPGDAECPLYCKLCKTKEQRDAMDRENQELQQRREKELDQARAKWTE
jgi:hypothetical protein